VTFTGTTTIAFGAAAINGLASQKPLDVITFTNNGAVASGAVTTSLLSGADTTQFAITANTCGASIPSGGSCAITVRFNPTTAGAKSASFTVGVAGDPNPALVTTTFNLSGTGVTQATLGISPSTAVNVGTRADGAVDPGAGTVFTITNGGAVASGPLSLTLSNSADFAIDATTCGATLGAGASCTANVTFNPTHVGAVTTALTAAANPGGSVVGGTITGTGTATLTAAPSPANLGIVAVAGIDGTPVTITFTNNADSDLGGILEPVVLGGTNANEVSVTNDGCAGTTLTAHTTAGDSCTITVVLVPSSTGAKTANLTVSGPGVTAVVQLTGTGN
jgi:hypothetical protein